MSYKLFLEEQIENEILKSLDTHRSIRNFDPNFEIPRNHIEIIVKAGQRASTSSLMQMYTLIEIPKEDRKDASALCGEQQFVRDASFFGILFIDFYRLKRMIEVSGGKYDKNYKALELTMGALDVGLFAQNMAIAAESLGYGICYRGGCGDVADEIFERLNIPTKVLPLSGFAIGKPLEIPKETPRLPTELIHHIGEYKEYSDDELREAMDKVSKGLSEKAGKDINWSKRLKNRFDGGQWAPTRNQKRKRFIDLKFGSE